MELQSVEFVDPHQLQQLQHALLALKVAGHVQEHAAELEPRGVCGRHLGHRRPVRALQGHVDQALNAVQRPCTAGDIIIDKYTRVTLKVSSYTVGNIIIDKNTRVTLKVSSYTAGNIIIDKYTRVTLIVSSCTAGNIITDKYTRVALIDSSCTAGNIIIDKIYEGYTKSVVMHDWKHNYR